MAGIGCQWLTSSAVMLAAPPGDAYLFLLNGTLSQVRTLRLFIDRVIVSLYPFGVYNTLIAGGLLWARVVPKYFHSTWSPPFRAPLAAIAFFFACSSFLLLAPFAPPEHGFRVYKRLPYWVCLSTCATQQEADEVGTYQIHATTGLSISFIGAAYWLGKFVWAPRRGGYRLDSKRVVGEDGVPRKVLIRISIAETESSA